MENRRRRQGKETVQWRSRERVMFPFVSRSSRKLKTMAGNKVPKPGGGSAGSETRLEVGREAAQLTGATLWL